MAKDKTKKAAVPPEEVAAAVPETGEVILIGNGTCHLRKGVEYPVTPEQAKILLKKGAGEVKQ